MSPYISHNCIEPSLFAHTLVYVCTLTLTKGLFVLMAVSLMSTNTALQCGHNGLPSILYRPEDLPLLPQGPERVDVFGGVSQGGSIVINDQRCVFCDIALTGYYPPVPNSALPLWGCEHWICDYCASGRPESKNLHLRACPVCNKGCVGSTRGYITLKMGRSQPYRAIANGAWCAPNN